MKALVRRIFAAFQSAFGQGDRTHGLTLVAPDLDSASRAEIERRAQFFFPGQQGQAVRVVPHFSNSLFLDARPILTFGVAEQTKGVLAKLHQGVFDIDWRHNPSDGWNWIAAATWASRHEADLAASKAAFTALKWRLGALGLDRCYVFGTGPSLGRAIERDWSDGIRVVCNTIVRDAELWQHISPHVLVAGDGIYHFGFTEFALAFRRDLRARLEGSPGVMFMYPAQFDLIVRREMGHLAAQLLPIPVGKSTDVHNDLTQRYELPALGNILNLLLLPVGSNLAKTVCLWGFDGRAPKDQLFWANSARQSYTELLPTLQAAHPAFFDHNVPKEDPEKYLRSVHGDVLEHALSQAEAEGWRFEMLHPTWTTTLSKRSAPGVEVLA